MTKQTSRRRVGKSRGGFTLIELLVVVLIIGILAAIAVPQYFKVVEKSKAAEANAWVAAVTGAQESYLNKMGAYCTTTACLSSFDVAIPAPSALNYFTVAMADGAGGTDWSAVMTRSAIGGKSLPTAYGSYEITYTHSSNPPMACQNGAGATSPCTDMMP